MPLQLNHGPSPPYFWLLILFYDYLTRIGHPLSPCQFYCILNYFFSGSFVLVIWVFDGYTSVPLYMYLYLSTHGLSVGTNIHHCCCLKLKLNSFLLWISTKRATGDHLLKQNFSLHQHEHCLPGLRFIQLIFSWQQISSTLLSHRIGVWNGKLPTYKWYCISYNISWGQSECINCLLDILNLS